MLEMPNDTIAQLKAFRFEQIIKINIKWKYFAVLHVVAYLPAKAAIMPEAPRKFIYERFLLSQIFLQGRFLLVLLPDVIGGRSDD